MGRGRSGDQQDNCPQPGQLGMQRTPHDCFRPFGHGTIGEDEGCALRLVDGGRRGPGLGFCEISLAWRLKIATFLPSPLSP
jgi:hypothetical protein